MGSWSNELKYSTVANSKRIKIVYYGREKRNIVLALYVFVVNKTA